MSRHRICVRLVVLVLLAAGLAGPPLGPTAAQDAATGEAGDPAPITTATPTADSADADVPTYRGNAARTGVMPGPAPSARPVEIWRLRTGANPLGPPAVVDGVVYLPTGDAFGGDAPGVLYALDATTGQELWRFETRSDIWATPTVADGVVYLGSEDGYLYALDAVIGSERWRVRVGPVVAEPVVVDGVVYVAGGGTLRALEASTGTELWAVETHDPADAEPAAEATLAVADGAAFLITPGGILIAVDSATGTERWRREGDFVVGPAVADGLVYVTDEEGLVAVDATTGGVAWEHPFPEQIFHALAVAQGVVYVESRNDLHALDARTGDVRWRARLGELVIVFAPVVADGTVLVTVDPLIEEGEVVALDAATGSERWRVRTGAGRLAVAGGVVFVAGDRFYALGSPEMVPAAPATPIVSGPPPARGAMFRADPAHTGRMPGPGPEGNPAIAWYLATDGQVDASPVLADGTIYVTSGGGMLYAVDAATGAERWQADVGQGAISSPAVVEGTIYVGGEGVFAFDATTGSELWTYTGVSGVLSSPTVVGGVVYVADTLGDWVALDAATGDERWVYSGAGFAFLASPAVVAGTLFGSTIIPVGDEPAGTVFAVDAATGEERWAVPLAANSSPAYADGVIYVGAYDNAIHALDAGTGRERWRFDTGIAIDASPAVVDGVVYVGAFDGVVYALDTATGHERWRFDTGESELVASAGVANGEVYVVGGDGTLFALNAATGKERWRIALGGEGLSSPLVAGGFVYVGGATGLYAIGSGGAATPGASPVAVGGCQVEPRPLAFYEQFVGTPAPHEPDPTATPTPTPFALPSGQPPDAATLAGIAVTVQEWIACTNAGDGRRLDALYTDAYLRRAYGIWGPLPSVFLEDMAEAPTPVDSEARRTFVALRDVTVLPDGRVAALVVVRGGFGFDLDDQQDVTYYMEFARVGDRWLIDEEVREPFEEIERPTPVPITRTPVPTTASTPGAAAEADATIQLVEFAFEPADPTIPANADAVVVLVNSGVIRHNLSVVALDISIDVAPGETRTIVINALPGEYDVSCNQPGHKESGMVGGAAALVDWGRRCRGCRGAGVAGDRSPASAER